VSENTRARLYLEADEHPAFEGMEPAPIQADIEKRLELFLRKQPWWYGHTAAADDRHHVARRQYQARREKERLAALAPVKTIHRDVRESPEVGDGEIQRTVETVEIQQIESVEEPQLAAA
jgi:hypothetical protein